MAASGEVKEDTVNVDISVCIHFRGFMKMGNFACIKIRVLSTNNSLGYNDSNFHSVYIFADIQETRIKRKYIQRENFYVYSILQEKHQCNANLQPVFSVATWKSD